MYIPESMMLEKVSKALADKNRLKIIQYLSAGQKNVSEVADRLNVEENLASHHLRVLASLGFLRSDKKGREVYYRINDTRFVALLKDLKRSSIFRDILLKALEKD